LDLLAGKLKAEGLPAIVEAIASAGGLTASLL